VDVKFGWLLLQLFKKDSKVAIQGKAKTGGINADESSS
jgi:hypothetical protein